jgi:hypothetical protein
MKKRAVFIFGLLIVFSVLSLVPLISAVEFDVNSNYSLGETMIAKVSGNFISPLTNSNVFFYQGHVRIPMQYNVVQEDGDYYIYAVLVGKETGDYSISIENSQYRVGAEVVGTNLVKNFSITNNKADFSVSPGAISTSGTFSIEIQNLAENQIVVDVNTAQDNNTEREILISSANSTATSFTLKSGEKKNIEFTPGVGDKEARTIQINTLNMTYKIPVYLSAVLEGNQEPTFSLEPSNLIYSFITGEIINKTVYLYNTGSSDIEDINLSLDDALVPFVNLSTTYIDKLVANSYVPIGLTFFSDSDAATLGNIKARTGDNIAYSYLTLRFIENYTVLVSNGTDTSLVTPNSSIQSSEKTCDELLGKVCSATEQCSQEVVYAKDNLCCLATCQTIEKSNSGTIIAVVIIIGILGIGAWFYLAKYKKSGRKNINLVDVAKGKN